MKSNLVKKKKKVIIMPRLWAYATMRCTPGDAYDAWAGLEIESDRWNLLCKFTIVARDDSRKWREGKPTLFRLVAQGCVCTELVISDPELSSKIRGQRLS